MKVFRLVAFASVLLGAVLIVRTMFHTPTSSDQSQTVDLSLDEATLLANLSQSIQFPTISYANGVDRDHQAFDGFRSWLKTTYLHVHDNLELVTFDDTLLYKWPGSDQSLKPILFTGHYDVVPVIPGTENQWQYAPYAGEIADGYVWGRGALDDKSGVIGILEAANFLLAQDFQPKRTIYLSFGHDEEIGGTNGAAAVTRYLQRQGVQLAWSLDEGSFLLDGFIPGVNKKVAAVNVAEKGYLTLEVVAQGVGGHSSMPPRQTAVSILAEAITQLENNPVPASFEGLSAAMFDSVSREMPFLNKLIFANRWLFGGLIERVLSADPSTDAMLRTTTAPTMLSASVKANVLPIEAVATINFRVHPKDSLQDVVAHVQKVVQNQNIKVRGLTGEGFVTGQPASTVSSWDSEGFRIISQSVTSIVSDVVVAPGLMIAASDSRHYGKVADNAYRFNPFSLSKEQLVGVHGTDERIGSKSYIDGIKIYILLMQAGSSQ